MYILNYFINGKTVKSVNYNMFHGITTNDDQISGPRLPFSNPQPIRCVYNSFDTPRIVLLSAQIIATESVSRCFPISKHYQFIPIILEKRVIRNYDDDFDFIYEENNYRRNPDQFIKNLVVNSPLATTPMLDNPNELLVYWYDQIEKNSDCESIYIAAEGHQSRRFEKTIRLQSRLIEEYGILRTMSGFLLKDEYFELLRPYIRDEYFSWLKYIEQ